MGSMFGIFGWVSLPVLDFAELGRSAAWVRGSKGDSCSRRWSHCVFVVVGLVGLGV